jgi:hypothetical protein
MEILGVFTLFALKHLIADYYTQYSWMIKDKSTYGAFGGIAHATWHGILTLIVLWLIGTPVLFSILLSALDGLIHYHIDYVKSNIWKKKRLTHNDQLYWVVHGTDQFLHLMTYVFIIFLLGISI